MRLKISNIGRIYYLTYNFVMKRFLLLLTIFCLGISVHALENTITEQVTALYNSNKLDEAMKVIKNIPENDRTAEIWLLTGNILQDQDKISDAVFMYKRAILVNPDYYKPYYNLANIYLYEERPNLAIENYKKAIKLKPDFAYGYYNTGCAYLRLGDYKHAKKYFSKAVELKNTEPDFQYNLAYTYKMLNKSKKANIHLDFYNKLISEQ